MTKKDYILLAKALKGCKPGFRTHRNVDEKIPIWKDVVSALTDSLSNENGGFDGQKFLIACGYYNEQKEVLS